MTIDIERLKTDAAYWDSVATEGAKYYCTEAGGFHAHQTARSCCIPRPTTQAAPEWDGELPPVGFTEKDCELAGVEGFHQGFEVVAHKGVAAIVWGPYDDDPEGQVETLLASHFRPIRTKEQRQKDELADLIENHQMEKGSFCTPENTAAAILSRYNLEPKL